MQLLSDPKWLARLQSNVSVASHPATNEEELCETWWTLSRSNNEWSLVMPQSWLEELTSLSAIVAHDVKSEGDRCLLEVEGPLPMHWVGILAGLSDVLANAGISIFCVSTFDTDYLLVESARLRESIVALRKHGYEISES